MKQLLGVALILGLGLVFSHRWFGRAKVWGGAKFYYLTGEEFLLVGLLLGPLATNLVDVDTLASLEPFVGLGLGYVGFLFGMQFRRRELAAVPPRFYLASVAQAATCALVLSAPLTLALGPMGGGPGQATPFVLALVAVALGTSTSFLYLVDRKTQLGRSDVFRFMRFSSVFDDLWGVTLFGAALCLLRSAAHGAGQGGPLAWFVVSVAVGLVTGVLLELASRLRAGEAEQVLLLLGIVLFSGGLAAYLRLSPIFTNLVAGVYFANRSWGSRAFHNRLLALEKPLYIFMLVLAGAMWQVRFAGLWPVLGLYVLVRTVAKYLGGRAAGLALAGRAGVGSRLGLGLLAQSEMAVAMMVNLQLLAPGELSRLVVSTAFVAVMLNDLASSFYYSRNYGRMS